MIQSMNEKNIFHYKINLNHRIKCLVFKNFMIKFQLSQINKLPTYYSWKIHSLKLYRQTHVVTTNLSFLFVVMITICGLVLSTHYINVCYPISFQLLLYLIWTSWHQPRDYFSFYLEILIIHLKQYSVCI